MDSDTFKEVAFVPQEISNFVTTPSEILGETFYLQDTISSWQEGFLKNQEVLMLIPPIAEQSDATGTRKVYLSYVKSWNKFIAIKEYTDYNNPKTGKVDQTILDSRYREYKTQSSLQDPHIPEMFGFTSLETEKGIKSYLASEFVDTRYYSPLRKRIENGQSMAPEELGNLLRQVKETLVSLHSRGIIYRDIKPENLLYSDSLQYLFLIDFGIADIDDSLKEKIKTIDGLNDMTKPTFAGSPGYFSREGLEMKSTEQRDIFGLTVTAIELLSGEPLFADSEKDIRETTFRAINPQKAETDIKNRIEKITCSRATKNALYQLFMKGLTEENQLVPFIDQLASSLKKAGEESKSNQQRKTIVQRLINGLKKR